MKLTKSRLAATIFYIFFAIVFVFLGFWQINRGNEKAEIIEAFEIQQTMQAVEFSANSKKWERVYINGELDAERLIFIDNIIYKGILGFKVVAPVSIEDNKIILVDFGWIKQPQSRDEVSFLNISKNKNISVSGVLEAPEMGLILSDDIFTNTWPKISQSKSISALEYLFKEEIIQFILLSDYRNEADFIYLKPIVANMPPVKHYGYAGQWFAMFIALSIMYLYFLRKSTDE
jgi:surfeit locus 1 family protein